MRGEIRIIGGEWRGRKLKVPLNTEVRPTPDRVRETLFNWLAPVIGGSYCLDAFTGSGALGFEALSRGAKHVVMVDQSRAIITRLNEELLRFKAENADIYQATMPKQLKKPTHPFDIVFLDPPYAANILLPTCFFLEQEGFLSQDAYIYIEAPEAISEQALPPHWQIIKCKKAGTVSYHLIHRLV